MEVRPEEGHSVEEEEGGAVLVQEGRPVTGQAGVWGGTREVMDHVSPDCALERG